MRKILYTGLDPTHYSASGTIIHCPFIRIQPRSLTDPVLHPLLCQFESYTHLLLTSKSTVTILFDYINKLGFSLSDWQKKIICVVGKVTALHVKKLEIVPHIVAKEETAEGMVQALHSLGWKDSHVFWPHSSEARPVLHTFLQQQNIYYHHCDLYDPIPCIPANLPSLESVDEIVFTSPSTVKSFFSFCHPLSHLQLTAIGPITAAVLKNYLQSSPEQEASQEFLPII